MFNTMISILIFINSFSLLIALLIIILDRVINNYGTCKITINSDKQIEGKGGKYLLRMLFENKYFIPSACGGKGTCGYCKVIVHSKTSQLSPAESLILSPKEIRQNYRLSCQLKVKEDLEISIPSEYLEIMEYIGQIDSTELVTSDIKRVRIKLINPNTISFKAGQYIQVKIPTSDSIEYRAYSMASNPEEKDIVELNVKLIPEGIGSSYVHSLVVGDKIEISGPYGDFYLRTNTKNKIVCIAGGVGLAPIKSIVLYWSKYQNNRILELYYGSRTTRDLYDHNIFQKVQEEFTNFRYFPALSMEDSNWKGEQGFINKVLEKNLTEGKDSEAYICGPPIMIDSVIEVLKNNGLDKERIYYDKF